jgi:lycopene cyclase domain-containing protein
LFLFPPKTLLLPPLKRHPTPYRNIGRIILALGFSFGSYWYPLYIGRILVWSVPVLVIQWEFGAEALLAHIRPLIIAVALTTTQLCLLDQWAISDGIWAISPSHTLLPQSMTGGIPLEEVLFFLGTSSMCCGGLTLIMITHQQVIVAEEGRWLNALHSIYSWGQLIHIHENDNLAISRLLLERLHAILASFVLLLIVLGYEFISPFISDLALLVFGVVCVGLYL